MPRAKSLASVLIVGVVSLMGIEFGARILWPQLTKSGLVGKYTSYRTNLWAIPDAKFHHVHPDFKKPDEQSEVGHPEWLFVGDSFVWGHGVEPGEAFPQLVSINHPPGFISVRATPSHSSLIYRSVVADAFAQSKPKFVFLFLDPSDPGDDFLYAADLISADPSPIFDIEKMRIRKQNIVTATERMEKELQTHRIRRWSVLYNYLFPFTLQTFIPTPDPFFDLDRTVAFRAVADGTPEGQKMLAGFARNVAAIAQLCERNGVPLYYTSNPWEIHVSSNPKVNMGHSGPFPRKSSVEALLMENAARWKATFVPLTPIFLEHATKSLFLTDVGDIHWNKEGHALVAQVVERALASVSHSDKRP